MPDSLKRQEEVTQILGCHEALMSYIIGRLKDNPEEEDVVKLCCLLKGYNRIVDYVKVSKLSACFALSIPVLFCRLSCYLQPRAVRTVNFKNKENFIFYYW